MIDQNDPDSVLLGSITFVFDADNPSGSISVNVPTLDFNKKYKIRRKLKLQGSSTSDVQNTYTDDTSAYVASNSLPHWNLSLIHI